MKYCSQCQNPVRKSIPEGDHRLRDVCDSCGMVFYENPKIVVGTILEWNGGILLCRRAIEPRSGLWTLPAGFMENGESTAAGALRETMEEAGAKATIDGLFSVVDVPVISQVHMFFRGRLGDGTLDPGPETLEAAYFRENQIPWSEIAFTSVKVSLDAYLEDRRHGVFGTHTFTLDASPQVQSSIR